MVESSMGEYSVSGSVPGFQKINQDSKTDDSSS